MTYQISLHVYLQNIDTEKALGDYGVEHLTRAIRNYRELPLREWQKPMWDRIQSIPMLDRKRAARLLLGCIQFAQNVLTMLVRLTPKSTRFGDDFVGTVAHWTLARLSPLHFGCCHEPVYSPSYVGATACPLIPSNDRNALNG